MATTDDEDDNICSACNGSGEGMHDGTRCAVCKGTGVERPRASDEDDFEIPEDCNHDYYY